VWGTPHNQVSISVPFDCGRNAHPCVDYTFEVLLPKGEVAKTHEQEYLDRMCRFESVKDLKQSLLRLCGHLPPFKAAPAKAMSAEELELALKMLEEFDSGGCTPTPPI